MPNVKQSDNDPLPEGEGRVRVFGPAFNVQDSTPSPQPSPSGRGGIWVMIVLSLFLTACWTRDTPAPVSQYRQREGALSTGAHTVRSGETVYNIAERYQLVMRDIIVVNNLQPPYRLTPGQRLMLPAPRTYKVRGNDTIYSVSRLFNVSTTQIAQLNTLRSPFILSKGQVLKLPVMDDRPAESQQASAAASLRSAPPMPAVSSGVTLPTPVGTATSRIDREELGAPQTTGTAIPAPAPKVVPASVAARIPNVTPPRAGTKFLRPVSGPVLSSYGPKPDGQHNDGVNIRAARGTPVKAAENGVIVYASNELKGYGNMVLIRHANRWMTAYTHLDTISLQRGATVKQGDTIGTVGSTGSVDQPQLHFEIRRGTEALNPEKYM